MELERCPHCLSKLNKVNEVNELRGTQGRDSIWFGQTMERFHVLECEGETVHRFIYLGASKLETQVTVSNDIPETIQPDELHIMHHKIATGEIDHD